MCWEDKQREGLNYNLHNFWTCIWIHVKPQTSMSADVYPPSLSWPDLQQNCEYKNGQLCKKGCRWYEKSVAWSNSHMSPVKWYIILLKSGVTVYTVDPFYYQLPQMSGWARCSCSHLFGVKRRKVEHSVEPIRCVVWYVLIRVVAKTTHLAFSTAPAQFWQGFINNVFIIAYAEWVLVGVCG